MNYFKIPVFVLIVIGLSFISPKASAHISTDSTDSTAIYPEAVSFISPSALHVHEISLWGGYSFDSFRFWGKTPDATMQTFGLRYNRKFMNFYGTEVEYIVKVSFYSKYSYPEFKPGRPRNSLTGFGIVPIGLQANFRDDKVIQPFLNSTGGFVFLDDPFPDWRGKKFNFTFGIGGGIEFIISPSVSLSLGLKYHHLSNGYRGEVNPGIDSSLFYTAITFF